MDKKYTISISIIIIIAVTFGVFLAWNNSSIPDSSELTDLFDYSIEPTTSWNDNKKEYSFRQSIRSIDGKDYKNIEIKVNFYKNNKLLDSYDSEIDKTKNGKFNLNFTKELSEEPDAFYYDVISATEV